MISPGVEEDGDMVVPVQEDERLLPENDEDGVSQLGHLAQGEHPVPKSTHSVIQETAKTGTKTRLENVLNGNPSHTTEYTK